MKGIFEIKKDFNYLNKILLISCTVVSIISFFTINLKALISMGNDLFFLRVLIGQIGFFGFMIWSIEIGLFPLMTLIAYEKSELTNLLPKKKGETLKKSLAPWIVSIILYFLLSILLILISIFNKDFNYPILSILATIGIVDFFLIGTMILVRKSRKGYGIARALGLFISLIIIERIVRSMVIFAINLNLDNMESSKNANIVSLVIVLILVLIMSVSLYLIFRNIKYNEKIINNNFSFLNKPYKSIFSNLDKFMIIFLLLLILNIFLSNILQSDRFWLIKDYMFIYPYEYFIGDIIITMFRCSIICYTIYNIKMFYSKDDVLLELAKNNKWKKFIKYMIIPIIIWAIYFSLYYLISDKETHYRIGLIGLDVQLIFTIVAAVYWGKDIIKIDNIGGGVSIFSFFLYLISIGQFLNVTNGEKDVTVYYFIGFCVIFILIERSVNLYRVKKKSLK